MKEVTNVDDFPQYRDRKFVFRRLPVANNTYFNDYFVNDFTWEEISEMGARNRMKSRSHHLDDILPKQLLSEAIRL